VRELILGMLGGTALLIYGLSMMGDGLRRYAGGAIKRILAALTSNTYVAVVVGAALTALVQSSSAITVLLVGFVNAGLMTLAQAVGVIYGANIGTTITAQLIAFKLTDYALLFVAIGFVIRYGGASERARNLGSAVLGFGLMFVGLNAMGSGIAFVQGHEVFRRLIEDLGRMPLTAILVGMVATMIVHASSAIIAVAMVLAGAGLLDLTGAICIVLGTNIGTSIAAQLASIGTNTGARRTAWAHTIFNVTGVILVFFVLPRFVVLARSTSSDLQRQIANSHTLFNMLNTIFYIPLTARYVRFLERLIPERGPAKAMKTHLDERLLRTPVAALNACRVELREASRAMNEMMDQSIKLMVRWDQRMSSMLLDEERLLNETQKNITKYLMVLTQQRLSETESQQASDLIQATNDLERMGDHFDEIGRLASRKYEEAAEFSEAAARDLEKLRSTLGSVLSQLPSLIDEPTLYMPEVIDEILTMAAALRQSHITRLRQGRCSVDAGVLFFDVLNHIESVTGFVRDMSSVLASYGR